jgi:hypothetical protein
MKKLLFIFLICCTIKKLSAQEAYLTKSLSAEMVKQVEAVTSGGNISVASVPSSEARIEVFAKPSGKNGGAGVSKEEIKRRMDENYDLTIQVAANKLTAIARSKKKNGNNGKDELSISFKIFVNKNVATQLTTSGGNIELKSISGEQQFTTSGGNLTVDQVTGKLKGKTSGGNIQVNNSSDVLELMTSGGDIEANNCTGQIKLTTSGGNIELMNLNGKVEASTSGGDIKANDVKGELASQTSGGNILLSGMACDLTASTSGGDIKVSVKESKKIIKLSNSGGKIELQLPAGKGYNLDLAADKINTGNLNNFSGSLTEDKVNGKLNGGGTQVTAKTSGKINLTFK